MRIRTSIDLRQLRRNLSKIERKQVPFATALAITTTVKQARDTIRKELPRHFTVRSKWTEKGIQFLKATKRHTTGYVFTRDEHMVKQELGGTESPKPGRKLALPRGVRRNKKQKITKANFPGRLAAKPRNFIAPLGDRGAEGIYQKVGRAKTGSVKLLYALHPRSVTFKPRWGFEKTVERVTRANLATNFRRALDRSIKTAK